MSMKNAALSPAVSDLGLGDMLTQQVQDQVAEQKKKKLIQQSANGLSPATMSLLGDMNA